MGFVERVGRERLDGAPERVHRLLGVAVCKHARGERFVLFGQDLGLLLAHGLAEAVCLARRVVGHLLRDVHDLLLVDDQAVRLVEDVLERLFQLRVDRCNRLAPVLAVRVVPVGVDTHRAGAVQGQRRHDVVEARRLHALKQFLHATRVELEHAQGVAARQQLVHSLVVGVERLEVNGLAAVFLHVLQRVAEHGEVAKAQEVHLQQTDGLAGRVIPAGDDRAIGWALPHRDVLHQRHRRHDHGTCVHARLPDHAFQPARRLVDLRHIRVSLNERAHLRGLRVPVVLRVGDAR